RQCRTRQKQTDVVPVQSAYRVRIGDSRLRAVDLGLDPDPHRVGIVLVLGLAGREVHQSAYVALPCPNGSKAERAELLKVRARAGDVAPPSVSGAVQEGPGLDEPSVSDTGTRRESRRCVNLVVHRGLPTNGPAREADVVRPCDARARALDSVVA